MASVEVIHQLHCLVSAERQIFDWEKYWYWRRFGNVAGSASESLSRQFWILSEPWRTNVRRQRSLHASHTHWYWIYTSPFFSWGLGISDGKAGHCVDVLRQQLMCSADIGLVGYNWVKDMAHPVSDFNTIHRCRDFDAVRAWNLGHEISFLSPNAMERHVDDQIFDHVPWGWWSWNS